RFGRTGRGGAGAPRRRLGRDAGGGLDDSEPVPGLRYILSLAGGAAGGATAVDAAGGAPRESPLRAVSNLVGDAAGGSAAGEETAAQEGPLQRTVAVHAAPAETGGLPRGVETRQGCAVHTQHTAVQIGLEAAQRLASEDVEPHADERPRLGVEQPMRRGHPDEP